MCLHICVIGFYLRVLLQRRPELAGKMVVIHRDKQVLDLAHEASARGILRGMKLIEAKGIVPEASYIAFAPDLYQRASEDWLVHCLEASRVIEPEEPHRCTVDLTAHPEPEFVARRLIQTLHHAGWQVSAGLAKGKWIARLAADLSHSEIPAECLTVVADACRFLDPLPTRCLPLESKEVERLEYFGYRTIKHVRTAPASVLRTQFGARGNVIFEYARGRMNQPIRAMFPKHAVWDEVSFEPPIEDLQQLQHALKQSAARLSVMLSNAGQYTSQVQLWIETDVGELIHLQKPTTKPLHTAHSLEVVMHQMMLESNISAPLQRLRCLLPNLEDSKHSQRDFRFTTSVSDRNHQIQDSLARIACAFGTGTIKTLGQVEISRRDQLLQHYRKVLHWSGP